MHSVAERISGCIAAFFCCTVRLTGEPLGSAPGTIAALTASAAPASFAMIMLFPLPGENGTLKDHAGTEDFSLKVPAEPTAERRRSSNRKATRKPDGSINHQCCAHAGE